MSILPGRLWLKMMILSWLLVLVSAKIISAVAILEVLLFHVKTLLLVLDLRLVMSLFLRLQRSPNQGMLRLLLMMIHSQLRWESMPQLMWIPFQLELTQHHFQTALLLAIRQKLMGQ